jgi:hypothetical protein
MKTNVDPLLKRHTEVNSWVEKLGPGPITGAADDDPSGLQHTLKRAPRSVTTSSGRYCW